MFFGFLRWKAPRLICGTALVVCSVRLICSKEMARPNLGSEVLPEDLAKRETLVMESIKRGGRPRFLEQFVPVTLSGEVDGVRHTVELEVSPDYIAVGTDSDYILMPLSPETAWKLAEYADCVLPTRRIVDAIYEQAAVKLKPKPRPSGPDMTTAVAFREHNVVVWAERLSRLKEYPLGALVAGHKKDVVWSAALRNKPSKVAIYGWHRAVGDPIQPLYTGHTSDWVDYSHGVRLVRRKVRMNGHEMEIETLLADPKRCVLLSDEGPLEKPASFTKE